MSFTIYFKTKLYNIFCFVILFVFIFYYLVLGVSTMLIATSYNRLPGTSVSSWAILSDYEHNFLAVSF